jgi:hypothetical protein
LLSIEKAQQYLKDSLQNQNVNFKEDQFEAIDSVVNQRKKSSCSSENRMG